MFLEKKVFKRDLFINKKDEVYIYIYVESGKSFVDYAACFFRKVLCFLKFALQSSLSE